MFDKKLMLKAVLFSSVCGVLAAIIFTCLLAAIMTASGVLSSDVLNLCTVAVLGISALFAGFLGARITKGAGLVVGALTGFALLLAVAAAGMISGSEITVLLLEKSGACILCGCVGGIIGVNRKDRVKI